MYSFMIVYYDGETIVVQQDCIASIVYMNSDINWDNVIAVFRVDC